MSHGIEPRDLTPVDVLDLAILVEEEAEERYVELARQMEQHHTPDVARLFRSMVENERKHGSELRGRRDEAYPTEPRRVDRSMLFDVEAPAFESVRAFMTPREALETALVAERKAEAFFAEMLDVVAGGSVAELLAELRDEERDHVRLVEAELARLAPEAGPHPSELADEPVGL